MARDGGPLLASLVALVVAGVLALKDVEVVRRNGQTPAAALWVLLSPVAYLIARTLKTNSSPLWPLIGIGLTVLAYVNPFTGDVTADSDAIERAIESDIEEQIDRDAQVRCDDVPATASVGDTITCVVAAAGADSSTATVEFTDDGGYSWSLS